ncbi:MAG: hypothetical protein ACI9CF_001521 [Candidatus Omnitrophota bacterium]
MIMDKLHKDKKVTFNKAKAKQVIGWCEYVDLPEWDIKGLVAKIDTGAKTSSLDVDHIELLPGRKMVKFNVVLSKHTKAKKVSICAKLSRISKVKASPIHNEERFFVKTKLKLGEIEKEIELNLIDRSNMVYRMLIGRSAIKNDFLVDAARSHMLSPIKKKRRIQNKIGEK